MPHKYSKVVDMKGMRIRRKRERRVFEATYKRQYKMLLLSDMSFLAQLIRRTKKDKVQRVQKKYRLTESTDSFK